MDVGKAWVEIAAAGIAFEAQSDSEFGIELAYSADPPDIAVVGLWIPGRQVFRRGEIAARAWCRLPPAATVTPSNLRIFTGP